MHEYPANADSLLAILRKLRSPEGCPWDREQTRQSLVRHLDGECAELIYAIDREDIPNICEELGDVLMNLFFQVVVAEEKGEFTLEDVNYKEINIQGLKEFYTKYEMRSLLSRLNDLNAKEEESKMKFVISNILSNNLSFVETSKLTGLSVKEIAEIAQSQ